MFQWSYFILCIVLGFTTGYTNPAVPHGREKPISALFRVFVLISIVGFIGSVFIFGIFWGIVTALEIGVGYYFGRKIAVGDEGLHPQINQDKFLPNENVVKQASVLLKEATALKKTDISAAIEKINKSLNLLNDYPLQFRTISIKKLANYQSINGNYSVAISVLHTAYKEAINSKEFFIRVMHAYSFIEYIASVLKKLKINSKEITVEALKLYIVALAIQGRFDQISTRVSINEYEALTMFLNNNLNALKYFNSNDFTRDRFAWEFAWENDERLNNYFINILSPINETIEILVMSYTDKK